MTGTLAHSGDGGGFEHCASCGALAAGPCARCRKPLCGDCCVIVRHGANPWAVCKRCARRQGKSLAGPWLRLGLWLLVVLVGLGAVVGALGTWVLRARP